MKSKLLCVIVAGGFVLYGCGGSTKKKTHDDNLPPAESAADVTGDQAVALGAAAAQEIMNTMTSSDSDATNGGKELNELVPQMAEAAKKAPPVEAGIDANGGGVAGALVLGTGIHRQAMTNSDSIGPSTRPDGNDGWYYWEYSWDGNTWRTWMKCGSGTNLSQGWPAPGETEWWYGWTGEEGYSFGYKYWSHYELLSGTHTAGTYQMEVTAGAWNGSWSKGQYDWTNTQTAERDYLSWNSWQSHWINESGAAQENYGTFATDTLSLPGGGWSSKYAWYLGAGTTVDPLLEEAPACPGSDWAQDTSGVGLVYFGEGSSEWSDGGWSSKYCSYRYDCSTQCYEYSRPLFSWDDGCVRSLSVFEGDYQNADESAAKAIWTVTSKFDTGAYIASPVKYNSAVAGAAAAERGGGSLSSETTYTVVLKTIDGTTVKQTLTGGAGAVALSLSGDSCGGQLTTVAMTPTAEEIVVGDTVDFYALALDNYANPIPVMLTWATDDAAIATVSRRGVATGVAAGAAKITASYGDQSATADLTVHPATDLPAAPQNVTAVAGNNKLTIGWSHSSGATSYTLYWLAGSTVSTATGQPIAITQASANAYTHVLTGLTNGTAYAVVLTASNALGEGAPSSVVTGTPVADSAKVFGAAVQVNDSPMTPSPQMGEGAVALLDGKPVVMWGDAAYDVFIDSYGADGADGFSTDEVAFSDDKYQATPRLFIGPDAREYVIYTNTNGDSSVYSKAPTGSTFSLSGTGSFLGNTTVCGVAMSVGDGNAVTFYVVYMNRQQTLSLTRSSDGGETWLATPVALTNGPTSCYGVSLAASGASIYLAWPLSSNIKVGTMDVNAAIAASDGTVTEVAFPATNGIGTYVNVPNTSVAVNNGVVAACWSVGEQNAGVYCNRSGTGITAFAATPTAVFTPSTTTTTTTSCSGASVRLGDTGGMHVVFETSTSDNTAYTTTTAINYTFSLDGAAFLASPTVVWDSGALQGDVSTSNPFVAWHGGRLAIVWYQGTYAAQAFSYTIRAALGQ